jgi:hypothetical protein
MTYGGEVTSSSLWHSSGVWGCSWALVGQTPNKAFFWNYTILYVCPFSWFTYLIWIVFSCVFCVLYCDIVTTLRYCFSFKCIALCLFMMYVLLPKLRFFHAFSSIVRQMPGYNSQRRGTARTSQISYFFIVMIVCLLWMFHSLYSVYCLCVNVHCTAATGCQPNFS